MLNFKIKTFECFSCKKETSDITDVVKVVTDDIYGVNFVCLDCFNTGKFIKYKSILD